MAWRLPEGCERMAASCNICGGSVFRTGPSGRMSENGLLPGCCHCGSLERHRGNRALFNRLPIGALSWRGALQFSPDMALSPAWFKSFEVSTHGGENSLDLQAVDRPDGAYDFITLSHVLEFVPDDHAAFGELVRLLSPRGLLHMVLSRPQTRAQCQDFLTSVATTGEHRYFHLYGRDIAERFRFKERGLHLAVTMADDPVTGVSEAVHFVAKDANTLDALMIAMGRAQSLTPLLA
ncbi:class I SAM-dependent methyltransferase [Niveispirillum sp. KHB5.9]|uniref:class I SAM-dependent methyltransferase n=1 Tax=Niveispirillum sp. KHB5.9 TaxID=3400269 RepID=UPI003A88A792